MQIYLLKDRGKFTRLYAVKLGTLKTEIAEYSIYMDYKGGEWLYIYHKTQEEYFIWPFVRVATGEEYLEYIKHI